MHQNAFRVIIDVGIGTQATAHVSEKKQVRMVEMLGVSSEFISLKRLGQETRFAMCA